MNHIQWECPDCGKPHSAPAMSSTGTFWRARGTCPCGRSYRVEDGRVYLLTPHPVAEGHADVTPVAQTGGGVADADAGHVEEGGVRVAQTVPPGSLRQPEAAGGVLHGAEGDGVDAAGPQALVGAEPDAAGADDLQGPRAQGDDAVAGDGLGGAYSPVAPQRAGDAERVADDAVGGERQKLTKAQTGQEDKLRRLAPGWTKFRHQFFRDVYGDVAAWAFAAGWLNGWRDVRYSVNDALTNPVAEYRDQEPDDEPRVVDAPPAGDERGAERLDLPGGDGAERAVSAEPRDERLEVEPVRVDGAVGSAGGGERRDVPVGYWFQSPAGWHYYPFTASHTFVWSEADVPPAALAGKPLPAVPGAPARPPRGEASAPGEPAAVLAGFNDRVAQLEKRVADLTRLIEVLRGRG